MKRAHTLQSSRNLPASASPLRQSRRLAKRARTDFSVFETYIMRKDTEAFGEKIHKQHRFPSAAVTRITGRDLTCELLVQTGFRQPLFIPAKDSEGLGLHIPRNLTVERVIHVVGATRQVPAMDVATQTTKTISLAEYQVYHDSTPEKRRKMFGCLNVISLEVSDTILGYSILAPRAVRQVDWIDLFYKRLDPQNFPRVQKYCLMSIGGCYTDFHIDFCGTSVWYHIVYGEKWFYLIEPTPKNLKAYETWTTSIHQGCTFFPEMLDPGECKLFKFGSGDTLMIPSGWIHAVYTPVDSMVIGGNFLASFAADMQLKIYQIENRSKVAPKYRFPNFGRINAMVISNFWAAEEPVDVYAPVRRTGRLRFVCGQCSGCCRMEDCGRCLACMEAKAGYEFCTPAHR